ncbi:MAG TPA: asparagine synthase (glutamine-hydrolyzing) [Longimicrobiaceae bacterium]|jgi:asparagine synthase (glutamine-hydrolysing)
MCGIAGAFGGGGALEAARRMGRGIAHRGPDGSALAALHGPDGGEAGAFAHARLAVIDPTAAGDQPMATEDGRYTLVFNGAIYNYRALRDGLRAAGDRFRGGSDTEVLLLGLARHGPAFLERLRGMFALALWDRERGEGLLARDRCGIKPLYLADAAGRLVFASELRAVLASGWTGRVLCPGATASYLAAGSVEEPRTAVRGVGALPPGTWARFRVRGGAASLDAPREYAGPLPGAAGEGERDPARAARRVREALRDSVEHHLVADVPVGFFLSGGIDSSAVAALAAEVRGGAVDTFTVVFDEREFSEAPVAAAVARRLGARHHEIPLAGEGLLAALPDAFGAMDQPSMDGLNTYVVSRAVRESGLKVVLSGLGGDELFAGYPSFRRARALARLPRWTGPLRRAAASAAGRLEGARAEKGALLLRDPDPALAAYRASRTLFGPRAVRALAGRDADPAGARPPAGLPLLQRVSWHETAGYMRDTLLRDSDVFSMAHGLELRVPFVDPATAAAAAAADDRLKLGRGSKPLLVAAVADLLPREVWDRPKQGFTLPFAAWLRGALHDEVAGAFAAGPWDRVGVDGAAARGVWSAFRAGRVGWSRPWALYTLLRWARHNGVEAE